MQVSGAVLLMVAGRMGEAITLCRKKVLRSKKIDVLEAWFLDTEFEMRQ